MRNLQEMAKRISTEHCGKGCDGCPAAKWRGENNVCLIRRLAKTSNCEEQITMLQLWDEEHPEERYPTWYEVWAKKFPNGMPPTSICPAFFDMNLERRDCSNYDCDKCRSQPITENVAKALGVEPIVEHDGRQDCIHFSMVDGNTVEPCKRCKGSAIMRTEDWKRRADFYER